MKITFAQDYQAKYSEVESGEYYSLILKKMIAQAKRQGLIKTLKEL